ncbi:MAG: hypothetical protein IPP14_07305 [Planctomycetes bacterium]|nr:hypothetical protein [Planctomycetota bacterium]
MRYLTVGSLIVIAMSLAVIAAVELATPVKAQKETPPAAEHEEAGKKEATEGVKHVRLAAELAQWGRDNKHPGALALASRILADVPLEESSELGAMIVAENDAKPVNVRAIGSDAVLKEALEMCGEDVLKRNVMDAIAKMGLKGRGAIAGAVFANGACDGKFKDAKGVERMYQAALAVKFKKGELAAVWVGGQGDGELDLYILDAAGNRVASDETKGDSCWCDWTPKADAEFKIIILNRSDKKNSFSIVTN